MTRQREIPVIGEGEAPPLLGSTSIVTTVHIGSRFTASPPRDCKGYATTCGLRSTPQDVRRGLREERILPEAAHKGETP